MDLQGKIIAVLEPKTGTSARGEWKVQEFVLETNEAYPKKMVFSVFGDDRLKLYNIQQGQDYLVRFDIDAHEYNGRWFNSIRAFDVRPAEAAATTPQQQLPSRRHRQHPPHLPNRRTTCPSSRTHTLPL